jgi:branched-chain amino acid transport system ATP-binding protein
LRKIGCFLEVHVEQGRALIEGTPTEVQSDPRVIEAYIGTGPEDAAELEEFEEEQDNA